MEISFLFSLGTYFVVIGFQWTIFQNGVMSVKAGRSVTTKRATKRQPWQINQDICPPSLCGPQASPSVALTPGARNTELPSTFPFFEGDIVLDDTLRGRMGRGKRAVIRPISHLWRYGIVPYRIDPSFNGASKRIIRKAMEVFQNKTCIKFQRRNGQRDYVQFSNEPGCWSFVGKRSIGVQKIGVGDGCMQLGTIMHEIGHVLGFWHEQSRADRDEYIDIVEKNVADRYLDQFDKRLSNESTTRGYPYDYKSIMHYGKTDFSLNGKPTLKVHGVGEELDVRIGQRKRLSDLDIAQLKDIYYCNQKSARDRGLACESGWIKNNTNCYKFETSVRKHFAGAVRYCNEKDAHVVHIETEDEDAFIKEYLITHHPNIDKWRAGAKKVREQFVWFDGRQGIANKRIDSTYTAWTGSYPRSYTTMTLEKYNSRQPRFVWRADWAGDADTPKFALPFICEKTVPSTKCFRTTTGDGSDYRGHLSYTTDFLTCQKWTDQYPHKHSTLTGSKRRDEALGLGAHNYCRNPNGIRERPWCYTTKKYTEWQYCDVMLCQRES